MLFRSVFEIGNLCPTRESLSNFPPQKNSARLLNFFYFFDDAVKLKNIDGTSIKNMSNESSERALSNKAIKNVGHRAKKKGLQLAMLRHHFC